MLAPKMSIISSWHGCLSPSRSPRLASQREDYLVKALHEYKSNVRRGYDASLADEMYPVTDADSLDLAHFLARLQ
jgi:cytochrome c553